MQLCSGSSRSGSDLVVLTETFLALEFVLIAHVVSLPAKHKYVALEESSLFGWIAKVLHPYVTEVIVRYPLHN